MCHEVEELGEAIKVRGGKHAWYQPVKDDNNPCALPLPAPRPHPHPSLPALRPGKHMQHGNLFLPLPAVCPKQTYRTSLQQMNAHKLKHANSRARTKACWHQSHKQPLSYSSCPAHFCLSAGGRPTRCSAHPRLCHCIRCHLGGSALNPVCLMGRADPPPIALVPWTTLWWEACTAPLR